MLNVKPSLDRVDVLVEVNDAGTVIPRNSVIEANQSGLIAEPLVDITPQLPLPTYTASEWGEEGGGGSGTGCTHCCRCCQSVFVGLRDEGLVGYGVSRACITLAYTASPLLPLLLLNPHTSSTHLSPPPSPSTPPGPLDPRCQEEAAIVCNNGHIKGQQVGDTAGPAEGGCVLQDPNTDTWKHVCLPHVCLGCVLPLNP